MKIKKSIKVICAGLSVCMISGLFTSTINAQDISKVTTIDQQDFKIYDQTAEIFFENLIQTRNITTLSRNDSNVDALDADLSGLSIEEKNLMTTSFSEIVKLSDGNMNSEVLYHYQDENIENSIVYDKTENSYMLTEYNAQYNTLTYSVNGQKYMMDNDENYIDLIAEDGSRINIFTRTIVDEPFVDPNLPVPYANWTYAQSFVTSNTYWLECVQALSTGFTAFSLLFGGVSSTVAKFIGTVAGVVGIGQAIVGKTYKKTLYERVDQYYPDDCMTYRKMIASYYQERTSNGKLYGELYDPATDLPFITFHYSHTVRPDQSGQPGCSNYAES